jgi:hypothetical protein
MTPLLYFASFASVFALFASAIAVGLFVFFKSVRACARLLRELLAPPMSANIADKNPISLPPHHLKRAGQ